LTKCQARLGFEQFYCGIVVQARGHRVMTISPRFDQYRDAWDTCLSAQVICHSFAMFKRLHLYFVSVPVSLPVKMVMFEVVYSNDELLMYR